VGEGVDEGVVGEGVAEGVDKGVVEGVGEEDFSLSLLSEGFSDNLYTTQQTSKNSSNFSRLVIYSYKIKL
jgi:hypothetical protein